MGSLRIIAGSLKGRRVPVPEIEGVRPTPDRVREALFSILGEKVAGSRVLDAYAGSGALGLEAYSRGASEVIFLEARREVYQVLVSTLEGLAVSGPCQAVLGRAGEPPGRIMDVAPYDLILADPPYGSREGEKVLAWASTPGLLAGTGTLVLEREARGEPTGPDGTCLRFVRTARYGRTALDFYSVSGVPEPGPA